MLTKLKIGLIAAAMTLAACANTTIADTARTEKVLCRIWGESLPSRSRKDTAQTRTEIAYAYADFEAACPEFEHLVP